MNPQDCLPLNLQGPSTSITRIAAGLSGAGVYKVERDGQSLVLKVAAESESSTDWNRTLHIQQLAADAGLAPHILHVDVERRAVLTAFVPDRSFAAFYLNPHTREAATGALGRTVRRIHALPLPVDAPSRDPHTFLSAVWNDQLAGFALPDWAREVITRVLAETPPSSAGTLVVSHNDLNPSNLLYDGTSLLILDWAAAGPMDPFYDLAVLAVFLRMDDGTALRLLSAYDGTDVDTLPSRFLYLRRLAAALAGAYQLFLARQLGHPGSAAPAFDATLSLAEFYQRLRAGTFSLGTADAQWTFGLALLKECSHSARTLSR